MVPMKMASVGGFQGPRGSLFRGGVTDTFNLGKSSLGARSPENYYEYAKSEVRQYDDWLVRARKIANQAAREEVLADYYGNPSDVDSASFRRNSVAQNIAQAEAYTPVNYYVFSQSDAQKRVEKLNEWNKDLIDAVKTAENTYGSLPNPVVIETVTEVSSTPKWVVPVVVGALGIAALSALGVFGKR